MVSPDAGPLPEPRRFEFTDVHRLKLNGVAHEIQTETFEIRFARAPVGD